MEDSIIICHTITKQHQWQWRGDRAELQLAATVEKGRRK